MFDIFYIGNKPNLFPHERVAMDIFDAATKSRTKFCWVISGKNDYTGFDFHWLPPKWENHQTHIFGSQWQNNSDTYLVPKNITKESNVKNYRKEQSVTRKSCPEDWIIPDNIDKKSFDFSWHPSSDEPAYQHIFGTQWWNVGGPTYIVNNASEKKYHTELRAKTIPLWYKWMIPDHVDKESFDFSWVPHPEEPPYIYQFGTQWQRSGGPAYADSFKNAKVKYIDTIQAKAIPKMYNWTLSDDVDYSTFDFSWHPDSSQKEYKHIFGSQWQKTSDTSYYSGAEQNPPINYVTDIRVEASSESLPRYYIETTLQSLVENHPTERFWALSKSLKYDDFDFSWHPDLSQIEYLHVFGSQWQKHSETYYVNAPAWIEGKRQINYVSDLKTMNSADLDIFFIDKGNKDAAYNLEKIKAKYPQIQKTRYANSLKDTANRCATKSKTDRFWMISSELNYDDFDFSWTPEPWQIAMTHVFGTKWNKWSETLLISKNELQKNAWCADIKDYPSLNFVSTELLSTDTNEQNVEIWFINHYNKEASDRLAYLKAKYTNVKENKFIDNYLDAIYRCIEKSESSHIWVVSSICDYENFDFGWYPDAWQHNMLHVFGSNEQKCGDTFFVPVTEFRQQRKNITKLEDFNSVNYVSDYSVPRNDVETVIYSEKTLVNTLKTHNFAANYALFLPDTYKDTVKQYTPKLWSGKNRDIYVLSDGAEFALIPKDVVRYSDINTEQLYDYPFINSDKNDWYQSEPMDIIFLSNGEAMAERMWNHLNNVVQQNGYKNRVKRIDGVNGRANAYKACAEASETPWFFNVFAKLEVDESFNFNFQPDRMIDQQHYIFHAKNPVNGLEYGHQAMILYNKDIVLDTYNIENLDFTLSAKHSVVPKLSGVSHFNDDPLVCWRTSFRECIKLRYYADNGDYAAQDRLNVWLTKAEGENAEWCLKGANDAIEYYESVNGELEKLMLSFEWEWLDEYYSGKYLNS